MYDLDALKLALLALLGNGGMGIVVSYVWSRIEGVWPWAEGLDRDAKIGALAVLSALLVQAPVWFGVYMLILPCPLDVRQWISISFSYATIAFTSATATYNIGKARAQRKRPDPDWNCPQM